MPIALAATVSGLPLHPLAVHVPVVLLPLGALGLLLLLVVPRWRAQLAWPVIAVLAIATVGALVAKLSGEALAAQVGVPAQHQQLGNWLLVISAILLLATIAWWLWERRAARRRRPTGVVGVLVALVLGTLAVGSLIVAVLTGHSGAEAVWGDRLPSGDDATATSEPAEPGAAATAGTDEPLTLAVVAQHDDSASCWAAIEGQVYDLTEWVTQHPGGADRILAICGTDATETFEGQHRGQAEPEEQLSRFAIGALEE